jgi:hypothetical protein
MRPSPAMIVALIALVGAVGGSAMAGGGAVTKKQAKKIARSQANGVVRQLAPGLSVGSARSASNAGNADKLDGLDAAQLQRRVRWALVKPLNATNPDAAIVAQSGGITLLSEDYEGANFLDFHESVTNKGIIATPTYPSIAADVETVSVAACIGNDDDAAGDDCAVSAANDGETVSVGAAVGTGDYRPSGYFVALIP